MGGLHYRSKLDPENTERKNYPSLKIKQDTLLSVAPTAESVSGWKGYIADQNKTLRIQKGKITYLKRLNKILCYLKLTRRSHYLDGRVTLQVKIRP